MGTPIILKVFSDTAGDKTVVGAQPYEELEKLVIAAGADRTRIVR